MPVDFAPMRDVKRFKAEGYVHSESGETFYVGSPKSDRMARVYRYFSPHPRSSDLRVEHVFRRAQAKALAESILAGGILRAAAGCGLVFGWKHEAWDTGQVEPIETRAVTLKKTSKNTVGWLYGSVTSAVSKAVRAGDIDLDEYIIHLREHATKRLH